MATPKRRAGVTRPKPKAAPKPRPKPKPKPRPNRGGFGGFTFANNGNVAKGDHVGVTASAKTTETPKG